jgi:hypothetical protein
VPTPDTPGIPGWFIAIFVIVLIIGIGSAIWRAVVLRKGGLNPFVAREQLEARLAQKLGERDAPPLAQHAKSMEERLAELDDLHERGVISTEERAAGRAKIIGGD